MGAPTNRAGGEGMTQHDYKKAYEYTVKRRAMGEFDSFNHFKLAAEDGLPNYWEVVKQALRIAQKLQEEPSEGMVREIGRSIRVGDYCKSDYKTRMSAIFKATRDQMLKELE